ncbi:hypothetical protein SAOR_07005 [Salinisphaera orenii MK-B5]|uniref:Uncharacterized protein n=1 Tax=Salinisphaera orenii MK-B5 TaxID=856730 RepID=A0A423PQE2_9GAMM|nr:hypothetical protein [Salinisphaera orenii]ROO27829.1 hypothetical protein SAOR_07005 [Salinisphaera orenii MK-B5]
MSNLSRIAAVVGGLVLLGILGLVGFVVAPYVFGDTTEKDGVLDKVSAQLNTGLPTQVDEGTRLDDTSVDGDTLQYNYTILPAFADRIDRETFPADQEAAIRRTICEKARLRGLMKRDFRVAYRYRLDDGTTLGEITVARADCGG